MVTLHDIMTVDVITVSPDATLREVAELLSAEHISGVPVVSGEDVVGVVSATDLVEFGAAAEGGGPPAEPDSGLELDEQPGADLWEEGEEPPAAYFVRLWEEQDRRREEGVGSASESGEGGAPLDRHTAADVMTRTLCAMSPDTPVRDAAEYMLRAGIHRLLVIDDDRLVGVATTTDLMKSVSQYGLSG